MEEWIADLCHRLKPHQVSTTQSVLEQHSRDESYHVPSLPDVVVFPETTDDVVRIIQFAESQRIPVVPFGVGSSLEGHVIPVKGGIVLDMMRMNRILEVRPEDFLVCVEPGVTRIQLNDALRRHGLFFPVDPGADASLGGMAATNASGTTTVRYGSMRDNVRAAEIVVAGGKPVLVGSLTAKSSSGYHLTGLFVGSEGTLGVFTKLWLRVYGLPECMLAARAEFPSVSACVNAARAIMGAGISVARVELVSTRFIESFNRYKGTTYTETPTLFFEFHGSQRSVESDVALVREIVSEEGCIAFTSVSSAQERHALWETRHHAVYAFMHQFPGHGHMATDVCVPLSKLPEAVLHAERMIDETGANGAIIGHVGDGNFHASLAINPNDPNSLAAANLVNTRIVEHALSVGGTCTGEHGVGLGKQKYQEKEHGPAIELMRAIKNTFDPLHLFNPGKLVDKPES